MEADRQEGTDEIPIGVLPSASMKKISVNIDIEKIKRDAMNILQAENVYTFEDEKKREEKLRELIIKYIKKQIF